MVALVGTAGELVHANARGRQADAAVRAEQAGPQSAPADQPGRLRKAGFDRREWRQRLTDPDLERREQEFGRLVDLAAASADAREALESWASDPADADLAWTSRLALRELARTPAAAERGPSRGPRSADPFGLFDGSLPGFGLDEEPFRQLDRLHQQLQDLFQQRSGAQPQPFGAQPWQSQQSFKMESGSDGVKVEVESEQDGDKKTQVYEAPTMEQLLKEHPELEQYGLGSQGGGVQSGAGAHLLDDFDLFRWPGRIEIMPKERLQRAPAATESGMRTDILGVMMQEPLPDEQVAAGLSAGVGLRVERTIPGTIAHVLDLRRGDILLRLGGLELRSGEDVSRALSQRAADESIELEILDTRGARRTLKWSPEPAAGVVR